MTRADFCNALGDAIVTNTKDARGIVLMMVAVDDLAQLNKTYGYHIGDEIIAAIVRRVRGLIRRRDILGRYATNKIGIVLAPSHAEHMEFVANRLASAIRGAPIDTRRADLGLGAYWWRGRSARCQDGDRGLAWLRGSADGRQGPDRFRIPGLQQRPGYPHQAQFEPRIDRCSADRAERPAHRACLPAHRPSGTGEVAMYESLVRMLTPEGELMGAGAIVPVAERLGFLHLIDHRVMELALDTLRQRRDIQLTVNVGVDTALHPDWMAAFRAHLSIDTSVAQRLVVEITETSLIEDVKAAQRLIETIKDCGARVAIDDFGAGHTSFRNMRLLPIDILKIDGTFIKNLARSEDDRFFVQTLLQLARHLRIETVAEWVQDEETANLLTSWRVEYCKGISWASRPSSCPATPGHPRDRVRVTSGRSRPNVSNPILTCPSWAARHRASPAGNRRTRRRAWLPRTSPCLHGPARPWRPSRAGRRRWG